MPSCCRVFRYGGGGYHCTWMSEDDLKLFAEKGLWAITNPASNLKLASGIAPVTKMLERGINMAIGTDGAASNNALDMFREMYLAAALQKVYEHDASACRAEDVLKMACVGGARAMGLTDCDDIAPGKCADLIVTRQNPLEDLKALRHVDVVIARGKVYRSPKVKKIEKARRELDKFL